MIRMGLWRRAVDRLTFADARRPATFSADPDPQPIDRVIAAMNHLDGMRIDRNRALSVPAVLRGRNLICDIATLPLVQYGPRRTVERSPLLEQVDPDIPNVVTLSQTLEDLLFDGVSWWRITQFGANGYPYAATHLAVTSVSLTPPSGRLPAPLPSGLDPREATLWVAGEPVRASDLIRFDSPNPGLLRVAGRAVRRAILLDAAAETYANNPRPGDFFTPSDPSVDPVTDDEVREFLDAYRAALIKGTTAYIPAALKYNSVDVMSPSDLQLVGLQQRASLDIANAIGIDPEDLGISTTSRTYQNGVDRRQDRVNDVLSPYMAAITDRLSMGDVTPRGYRVCFDLDEYLRADPLTRAQVNQIALQNGWLTVDEVRATEDLPPLPAGAARPALAPGATDNVRPLRVAASAGTPLQFDDAPAPVLLDFSAEGFAVDLEARIIEGIAVPFGAIAVKNGRKYRFLPGSLKYVEQSRVKLLIDHDNAQPVASLQYTEARPEGQFVRYKVGRGAAGDKALIEADDKLRDGMSVGVDILETTPDPMNPGVLLVHAANWRETSLLAVPAFDDARVTRVAAAADPLGEVMDPCTTCGQHHAPGVACTAPVAPVAQPATFTAEQVSAMLAAVGHAPAPVAVVPPVEPRQVVNPIRPAEVAEAPLYRFDGGKGQRSFAKDVFSHFDGDRDLQHKAEEFVAEQMRLAFANITVSNVAGLNPTIQRPDLYVPDLFFARPIGSLVTGGVVDEITTQRLPKFSSASGLAATHSQGVEPTDGAFAATTQDVTPAAISGRVTVNREVIDQGGTPQTDQLIWTEMTQYYAKMLETRLVDCLQALSLSDTPIVGTDADLQAALLAEFAGLQFIAGGDRYRGLALNSDLYTKIIGAVDGDGRALFPMLNPANAAGTTASDFSSVRVGSKVGVPAWALSGGNGGPDKSFLFVPESVYQWFSAPRRIDLSQIAVATVAIGIWGYSAEFVSRNSDVIQLAYTAS